MPWFVKIEKGIVDKTTFDRYVSAHKDYVRDLISQGRAAKTGYWAERGGGMLLFKASRMVVWNTNSMNGELSSSNLAFQGTVISNQ